MSLRYITVDPFGRIFEVHDLLDRFTKPTRDPALAAWVMVKVTEDHSVEQHTNDVPVYTVH